MGWGAHGLRGTLVGLLEVRFKHFVWGKTLDDKINSLHDQEGPVLLCNLAMGSWGMLPWKIMKLISSEITGNMHFTRYS